MVCSIALSAAALLRHSGGKGGVSGVLQASSASFVSPEYDAALAKVKEYAVSLEKEASSLLPDPLEKPTVDDLKKWATAAALKLANSATAGVLDKVTDSAGAFAKIAREAKAVVTPDGTNKATDGVSADEGQAQDALRVSFLLKVITLRYLIVRAAVGGRSWLLARARLAPPPGARWHRGRGCLAPCGRRRAQSRSADDAQELPVRLLWLGEADCCVDSPSSCAQELPALKAALLASRSPPVTCGYHRRSPLLRRLPSRTRGSPSGRRPHAT